MTSKNASRASSDVAEPGRRERRKAATRAAIASATERLVLARGFDNVTVAEIAEAADVAVSTLFVYFESKEEMFLSRDAEVGAGFVSAVRDRDPNVPVIEALRAHLHEAPDLAGGSKRFTKVVRETPALNRYVDRMWTRHAEGLAAAIAEALGESSGDTRVRAFARYVVEVPSIVRPAADRDRAIDEVVDLLAQGWTTARPPRR